LKGIVTVPEAGEVYDGTVKNIQSFGAIVEILPGKEGLLHISELDHGYVERVEDYVQVGDKVKVQLIEVRDDGRLRLSRKPFLPAPENGQGDDRGGRGRTEGGGRGEGNRGGGGSRGGGGRGRDGGSRGGRR
jgi:polyribonucleotide nucleotidyltransferase